MKNKFKKGDKISIQNRFEEMNRLIKPFIEKYNQPVLVHATPNIKIFNKIIREHKLRVPDKKMSVKHSFIERMLKIYPCIFLSLGFTYAASYNFKYSFIFSLDYLKKSSYYKNGISNQIYRRIIKYFDENDPEILKELSKKNKTCKQVMDKFYNEEYEGRKKVLFDFWKIEKETFELIRDYPNKKSIMGIINDVIKEKYVKYPESKKIANNVDLTDSVPEITVKRDIELKKDKYFLGFYIRGKIPKNVKDLLITQYPNKILFDGKKIINIKDLNK